MNKLFAGIAAASFVLMAGCSSRVESPDLGKVLDVFIDSLNSFEATGTEQEASSETMQAFTDQTSPDAQQSADHDQPCRSESARRRLLPGL
ncbi:MAG: hypothetical protein R3F47_18975 [Gammaproteobacteria bacterium]